MFWFFTFSANLHKIPSILLLLLFLFPLSWIFLSFFGGLNALKCKNPRVWNVFMYLWTRDVLLRSFLSSSWSSWAERSYDGVDVPEEAKVVQTLLQPWNVPAVKQKHIEEKRLRPETTQDSSFLCFCFLLR